MKRTSRNPLKRTSRRPVAPHACVEGRQGLCVHCGRVLDLDRFHAVSPNPRGRIGMTKELAVSEGIGLVRDAAPEEQLSFLPPGVASRLSKMPAGLYSYGFGKRGESIRPFRDATLGGALTSTRIAAQKSHEYHWLVDNHSGYPVVARIFDQSGRTVFRIEEYAKTVARQPVMVEAKRKRTSRAARAA